MCLILFRYQDHPDYPLILVANRDEFYERPTTPAQWWQDHPDVLAGRDEQAGGTWLGIHRDGRFAAVTNIRKLPQEQKFENSRGDLVKDFLTGGYTAKEYLAHLGEHGFNYDGYNLIFGNVQELHYFSNKLGPMEGLPPDVHGISNAYMNTPWPKVLKGKSKLSEATVGAPNVETLFKLATDQKQAPDDELPDTGIGLEWERKLSCAFIESENYGTRCTTVLLIDNKGNVTFQERSHVPKGEQQFDFVIE